MKTLATILFTLCATAVFAQKWTFAAGYGTALPQGIMKQNIRMGHGVNMNLLWEGPSKRIAAGLEFNATAYGVSNRREEYEFSDGTFAPVDIRVANTYSLLMATTRIYMKKDGPVRPFASVRAGYSFFNTRLGIYDPDDTDSCEPIEASLLSRDGTFSYSAGGGIQIDLGLPFRKIQRGRYFMEISSSILQGGHVKYMSENPPAPQAASHQGAGRAQEVESRFLNNQTQVIHTHHVGYLYESFLQMVELRLDLVVVLGR